MEWTGRRVLVTGGASFIGSHLVDVLVGLGASVHIADNFVSGRREHVNVSAGVREVDLRDFDAARDAMRGVDVCFHLAARHGGRGFVDRHQAACATNFLLDGAVFTAAREEEVKVVYASSGCVYPLHLQQDPTQGVLLREDQVGPPYDADNVYGYAKLMGELTLRALHAEHGLPVAIGRLFTVYGERGYESHAVTAMIARARARQDPFVVWGTGEQRRNWTHVSDVVRGLVLLAERVDGATAVNLGTQESIRVIDAVHEVLNYVQHLPGYAGYQPRVELRPDAPTGPANRIADNELARVLLGWEPEVRFFAGLHRTIDWYFATKTPEEARAALEREG